MSRYMVRICSNGQIERIPCKGILKLQVLQDLVGGYIETVLVRMKPEEGVWPLLIVDEEGRLKGKPLNTAATLLADVDHNIVGDAVLVGAMGLVLKLPLLRGLNALGGGAVGLLEGALLLFLAVWVLRRMGVSFETEALAEAHILRIFTANTPLGVLSHLQ